MIDEDKWPSVYLVQRDIEDSSSSFADSKGHGKDGIGTKLRKHSFIFWVNVLTIGKETMNKLIDMLRYLLLAPTPLILSSIKLLNHEIIKSSLISWVL